MNRKFIVSEASPGHWGYAYYQGRQSFFHSTKYYATRLAAVRAIQRLDLPLDHVPVYDAKGTWIA